MKNKRIKNGLIVLIALTAIVFIIAKVKRVIPLSWDHNKINQPMFSNQAINGYDPVAFFTVKEAVIGKVDFSYNWKNATWNFSSEDTKQMFITNPEKYAPQFGGFCSFAVSKGFTANTDPATFEIIDNKLYLFADDDMKSNWMEDQKANQVKSESNWN